MGYDGARLVSLSEMEYNPKACRADGVSSMRRSMIDSYFNWFFRNAEDKRQICRWPFARL
jgi:hypothetical protein